jgi:hypothetical protein
VRETIKDNIVGLAGTCIDSCVCVVVGVLIGGLVDGFMGGKVRGFVEETVRWAALMG